MSAIAGFLRRNGRGSALLEVEHMVVGMRSRGPDYQMFFDDEHVALGFGALNTTREAWAETQPFVDEPSGTVVVADVRLDNRSELVESLRIRPDRAETGIWKTDRRCRANSRTEALVSRITDRTQRAKGPDDARLPSGS